MAGYMVKYALLIAFHFPPMHRSSGIQRTLKFATYLREHGWQPLVLTAHPRVYPETGPDQLDDIPNDVVVDRAFALDAGRHLAVGGRYPDLLARPDRYAPWIPDALWSGLRLVRRYRPDVLWSTFPVATTHVVAGLLHRMTGLPWVADFRDSMTEPDYPSDPARWRRYRRIERNVVQKCSAAVFTTPGAVRMYSDRYPDIPADRWHVIANGYDEENFRQAAARITRAPERGGPLRLVHAGVLYPEERDPSAFFEAVAQLKERGAVSADTLRIVLRATAHDDLYAPRLAAIGIDDIVELAPPLPYRAALAEMLTTDGLLLFQSAGCNHQIPAKVYEYMRAGRPILALTDAAGDTAATLREAGIDTIVPLDDAGAIAERLAGFICAVRNGTAPIASQQIAQRWSRASGTAELARLFDQVVAR